MGPSSCCTNGRSCAEMDLLLFESGICLLNAARLQILDAYVSVRALQVQANPSKASKTYGAVFITLGTCTCSISGLNPLDRDPQLSSPGLWLDCRGADLPLGSMVTQPAHFSSKALQGATPGVQCFPRHACLTLPSALHLPQQTLYLQP